MRSSPSASRSRRIVEVSAPTAAPALASAARVLATAARVLATAARVLATAAARAAASSLAVVAVVIALSTGCSAPPPSPTGDTAGRTAIGTLDPGGRDSTLPWVWPTGSRTVLRGWERPRDSHAAGHRGIDVAAVLGTTAVAVADGTVSFAGQVGGRGVVSIDHGGGLVSTLDSVEPLVAEGTAVAQGEPVGAVAEGHCSAAAPCLHLGARQDGEYVDPLPLLPAANWPVLLPQSAWPG